MTSTTSDGALNSLGKLFFERVIEGVGRIRRRADKGGDWPFDPNGLIRDLVAGRMTLDDPYLQAVLLDWIESEDRNVFLNQDTGEFVYVLSAKRGNKVYATRKSKKRNEIEAALWVFVDFPRLSAAWGRPPIGYTTMAV